MLLLWACPFYRHCVKLLFATPNNIEPLDMLRGQFTYRLRIGRRGRLCSSVSSPFGEHSTTNRFQKKCDRGGLQGGGGGVHCLSPATVAKRCWEVRVERTAKVLRLPLSIPPPAHEETKCTCIPGALSGHCRHIAGHSRGIGGTLHCTHITRTF